MKRRQQDNVAVIQTGLTQALKDKDEELAALLRRQRHETNSKLLAAEKAQRDLKLNFQRLALDREAQWARLLEEERERVVKQEKH